MAKGRELKGRIKTVENTKKITRTMEMVATSKMKRAQDRVVAARPYASALTDVISSLYNAELAERFPPSGSRRRSSVRRYCSSPPIAGCAAASTPT
jgi:F-type H+-transporting ATPase subunit gamma